MTELFCGVDAGAATTKVVLVDASGNAVGTAVRRARLLAQVWRDEEVVSRVIDMAVLGLRKKVEPDPAKPRHVVSVRGVGYRFVKRP